MDKNRVIIVPHPLQVIILEFTESIAHRPALVVMHGSIDKDPAPWSPGHSEAPFRLTKSPHGIGAEEVRAFPKSGCFNLLNGWCIHG